MQTLAWTNRRSVDDFDMDIENIGDRLAQHSP